MDPARRSRGLQFSVAVVSVALMIGLRLLLTPVLGDDSPFLTLFPALVIAAWYGGRLPALFALLLGALAAVLFIVPPRGQLRITRIEHYADLALFFFTGGTIILLTEAMRGRREAEVQKTASIERLALAVEAGHMGVWEWNILTDELCWSTRLQSIHDHFGDAFPPTREAFQRFIHPEDLASVRAAWDQAVKTCGSYGAEYRIIRPDGTIRWLADKGRVICNQDGRPRLMVGIAMDVTERRQAEAALQKADRSKNEFLATLAHELRNPLAPIRTALDLMRRASGDEQSIQNCRAIMERQVQQLTRLVDDLLDVGRITSNKLELRKERIELSMAIQGAVETAQPLIDRVGHRFTVSLPPEPIYLDADQTRLAQVLANLLNNAAKYTPRNGEIWLAAVREDQDVVVSVRDTGSGIAPEHQARIFELFTQFSPSLSQSSAGLGIGLALAHRLVAMHGGQITVHSEGVGKGSEFVVRLPLPTQDPPTCSLSPSVPAGRARRSLRILVVDDNCDAADSLADLLEYLGHTVDKKYDGLAALAALPVFQPEVVVLDIGMPAPTGYETAQRIRQGKGPGEVVLIALTGYGQEDDKRLAREAGFQHHLTKPVDAAVLERLLLNALVAASVNHGWLLMEGNRGCGYRR